MYKVSIIIPVYNAAQYIEDCFASIAAQTFGDSMECLFVDDCSTDNSVDVLNKLIESYKGPIDFKLLHCPSNGGASAARNLGTRESSGIYLYYLDSDDQIIPDCISLIMKIEEKHPGVDLIQAGSFSNNEVLYSPLHLKNRADLPDFTEDKKWIKTWILSSRFNQIIWNKAVRREWLFEHSLFFKEGIYHEDDHWGFRYAKYVNKLGICKADTYYYNTHEGSVITDNSRAEKRWRCMLEVYHDCIINIDPFCVFQQVWMIFKRLVYILSYCPFSSIRKKTFWMFFSLGWHGIIVLISPKWQEQ